MTTFDKWQNPAGGTALSSPPTLVPAEEHSGHHFDEGEFGEAAHQHDFDLPVLADSGEHVLLDGVIHEVSLKPTAAIKGDETPVHLEVLFTRGEETIGKLDHTVSTHVAIGTKVVIGGHVDVDLADVITYAKGPAGTLHVEYGA